MCALQCKQNGYVASEWVKIILDINFPILSIGSKNKVNMWKERARNEKEKEEEYVYVTLT